MGRVGVGMASHEKAVELDSEWYHVAVKSIGSNPNHYLPVLPRQPFHI